METVVYVRGQEQQGSIGEVLAVLADSKVEEVAKEDS